MSCNIQTLTSLSLTLDNVRIMRIYGTDVKSIINDTLRAVGLQQHYDTKLDGAVTDTYLIKVTSTVKGAKGPEYGPQDGEEAFAYIQHNITIVIVGLSKVKFDKAKEALEALQRLAIAVDSHVESVLNMTNSADCAANMQPDAKAPRPLSNADSPLPF